MASLGDRLGALFGAPAPSAPAPVRNTTPVYTSVPLPQAPARYVPAATQRNTYTGGMGAPVSRGFSAPAPRRDVVQSLFELASQRSAPVRSLGVSPVVALPVNRAVQTPRMGLSAIPGIGNVLNAAAQQQAPRPGMAMIPGLGNAMAAAAPYAAPPRNRVSAAGEVADALMQRAIAGQQALENQMFDVQIQQTKDIAGPGYDNEAVEDNRYEEQQRLMDAYRRRIQAVQPYVTPPGPPRQPGYNVLSSANPGTPQRPSSVNADQYRYEPINITQGNAQAGSGSASGSQPTVLDPAMADAQQYAIEQQQRYAGEMLPPIQAEMLRAGDPRLVKAAIESLSGGPGAAGQIPRGGDSDAFLSQDFGAPIGDAIKEYGGQGAEWFFRTPVGEQAIRFLNGLNRPYEWNADVSGDQWYNAATGNYPQGEGRVTSALGPVGAVLDMSPDTAIALAFYAANPELREGVIQAYEQGYSSPEYIALMEESGVEDYAPQFEPGGFAVHEYLIGQTDDWPPALRDLVRLGEGVVMDPLTYLTVVGGAGKGLRAIGKAMATAEDSSGLTRVAGRAIETTGGVVEIGARAPDAVFEAPIAGFNWWRGGGRPAPGRPGLLQLSPDQQVMDAHTQAAHAAGLVSRNTDVGETVLGPDQAMADFHASNPEPPTHSTVEDAADIADGLVPPPSSATTGPRIVRPDTGTVGAHTYVPSSATTTPFVRLPPAPSDAPPVYWHTMTNSAGVTTHTAYVGYTGNVRVVQRGQSVKTQVIDGDTGEWVTTQSEMIPSGAGDPLEASRDVDQAFSDAIHEARISGQPDTAPIGRAGGATPQTNPEHEAPPSSTVTESEASPGRGPSSTVAEPEQPGQTVGRREPVRGREPEREPEPVRTGHQPQRIADPPENAANLDGATRPSAEPVSVSAIPDEFPRIQAAVARGGKLPDTTGRTPGESYFTPVYGGSRLPDAAITRAVVDGDLDAMRAANQLADEVDRLLPFLTDHPWYRGMLTEGGQGIHGLDVVPRMSRDQAEALVEMNRHTSRSQNPVHIAAGMGKAVLEKAKELEFLAAPYAEMHRTITGVNPVNTPDDVLFGFTWTGTGATGPSHRVQYLMERFVTTSSDEYANTILDWLRTNRGNDVLNTTNGPIPYLQGIPDPFRDEVLEILEASRANYRAVVNASDADFASGAWREGVATTPRSADQLAGGLKGSSKQASKMVEKWMDAAEPKRTQSALPKGGVLPEGMSPEWQVWRDAEEKTGGEIRVSGNAFEVYDNGGNLSMSGTLPDPGARVTAFKTEKGSVYRVAEDGTTIRDKAARPEHPGDAGVKPASSITVYLHPFDASDTVREFRRTGQFSDSALRTDKPVYGWQPFEIMLDANGNLESTHLGNRIVAVQAEGGTPPRRTPAEEWIDSRNRGRAKPEPYSGKPRGALGFAESDPISNLILDEAGRLRLRKKWKKWFDRGLGEEQPVFGPDVAAGHTRLYRVEYDGPDKRPDFIRLAHIESGHDGARGRWFLADPGIAHFYIEDVGNFGKSPIRIRYVDVPTNEMDRWRVRNVSAEEQAPGFGAIDPQRSSLDPDNEFFVTRPMAEQARTLSSIAQRRFGEYANVRNDWFEEVASSALAKKPRGALGFTPQPGDVGNPLTDALVNVIRERKGRGWLRGKLEQAQRTADDAAVPNVQNRLLAFLNETAAPGFDRKTTEYLNSPLPGWSPPNRKQSAWAPDEWTVFDALQWGHNEKVRNADFDYHAFVNHIGEVQAGIPPRMSAAEKKAARAVAKANGDPMPNFSLAEKARTAAHVAVNANDAYLRQIRQASLFGPISGPAGFVGDVVGNAWSAIVNGHFGAATDVLKPWKTIGAARTYRTTRVPVEMVNPWEMQSAADGFMTFHRNAHQAADALMTDVLRETGQMLPIDMYPAGTFREVPVSGKPSLNAAVENRGVLTRAAANLWTVTAVKDGRTATDLVGRTSIAKRVYADTVRREGMLAFRKLVIEKAGLENADQIIRDILAVAEQSAKDAGVPWKGNFSPADIKKATEGQSYSNPLARGWQSELNRAMDIAMTEQKRAYFSYKNTRADEAIANVLMFHYWQTRASYMHLRAALRHPVLLNGYYKIFEELRERNEQGGTGYLGPMYKFMTSPSGIYAAVEPLGFLIPMTLIDMQDQEGNPLRVLQNQVNPVIGTLLAVAGISDNVPNVTGLRTTQRWLVNMGNFLVANGVDMDRVPLLGRVWDNNTMQLRMPIDEAVSSILQEINQWWSDKGVPVGDFAPFDRGANERDQLNTWVLKGVEAEYGPMDPNATSGPWGPNGAAWAALDDALDALTTGTPNAIADEAERQYALEGLIAAMAAPFVPGGVITRSEYRDQQIAGNAADDPAASLNRDIVTSGSPTWEIMQQQYNTIGTPEQQRIYDMYLDMLMNPDEMGTVISRTPGGKLTVIRPSQIQGMSDAEREDFVNRWIAQNPGFEEAILAVQQGRDAFKAANPQFQEFKEYQKFVYNEDGKGIRAIRTTLERENPNFGRKIKEYRDYLKSQGITGPELERRLDAWAAGVDGYRAVMGIPIKNGDKVLPVYDPSTNPYASSAFAGMNAGGGASGSGGSGGKGSKLTKGPDGKLYNEDGQMVNSEGKPINDKGQVIDDYWYPDKVAERLAQGVAKYDLANQLMEEQFGDLWNQQTGKWEEWANSSSERRKLGYGGIPYALPEKSDLMREFEAWRAANGGGTVEDWFVYLMNEPGYGVMADPAVTLGYGETESAPTSLGGRLDALWNGGPAGGAPVNGWLWNILHS